MIHIDDYIAPFLMKNKYCTFPGLGTMTLKRNSASYDRDSSEMQAPNHEITFDPIGSIDDVLAAFIATRENVSIAKASNEISSFCRRVKADLQKRGMYEIDYLGKYTLDNGKLNFKQNEDLDLGRHGVQTVVVPEKVDEEAQSSSTQQQDFQLEYTNPENLGVKPATKSSIIKYLIGLLLLIGLAAAAYFGYKYYSNNLAGTSNDTEQDDSDIVIDEEYRPEGEEEDAVAEVDGAAEGSTAAVASGKNGVWRIAVKAYGDKGVALSKAEMHKNNGNVASVVSTKGSHYLVIQATSSSDSAVVKDSLKRFFNPSGNPFVVK